MSIKPEVNIRLISLLKNAKSISRIKRSSVNTIWKHIRLAYRANEEVLLIYDDHHRNISWQWIHLDRGVISFEEALSECPNLAFDLDIFLSLDETTLSFKREEARKKYEE